MKLAVARNVCRKSVIAGGRSIDRYIDAISSCVVRRDAPGLRALRDTVSFTMIEKVRSEFGGTWDAEHRRLVCDDGVHTFVVNPILDPFNCVLERQAPGTFCGLYAKSSSGENSLVAAAAYVNSTVGVLHGAIHENGLRWNNRSPKKMTASLSLQDELQRCAFGCDVGMGSTMPSVWSNGQIRPLITSPLLALLAYYEERVNECHLLCSPETVEGMAFFAACLTDHLNRDVSGLLSLMSLSIACAG